MRPNARNWRTHPAAQREALRGILAEVGYAGALVARELPDGSLELIDGHLRAETTPNALVPVLVLDVSEAEALKLLATYDPLAALAETNQAALDSVLSESKPTAKHCAVCWPVWPIVRRTDPDEGELPDQALALELFQVVVECEQRSGAAPRLRANRSQGLKCRLLNL